MEQQLCGPVVVSLCLRRNKVQSQPFVTVLWSICMCNSARLPFSPATVSVTPVIVCACVCPAFLQIWVSRTPPLAQSLPACVQWSPAEPLMSSLNSQCRARVAGPPGKTGSRHKHLSLSDPASIAALLCAMKFICHLCYRPLFVLAPVRLCICGSSSWQTGDILEPSAVGIWVVALRVFDHFSEPLFPVFTDRTNVSTLAALGCLRQHTESETPRALSQMFWVSVGHNNYF